VPVANDGLGADIRIRATVAPRLTEKALYRPSATNPLWRSSRSASGQIPIQSRIPHGTRIARVFNRVEGNTATSSDTELLPTPSGCLMEKLISIRHSVLGAMECDTAR